MRIKLFATHDKAKPDIENIKGLNLEAVRFRLLKKLSCGYRII
jgi:hypothetical protein